MGRKRAIPDAQLLDAAESVVRRDGAARLTLDAVAAEAGISKSSVLYAVGSKRGLIRAIVERRIDEWHGRCAMLEEALADRPNRTIEAVLELIAEPMPQADRSVAVSLSAAVFSDETVRAPIQRDVAERFRRVARDAPAPTGAVCALLAIEGLLSLERFDLLHFEPEQRARLLAAISWLAEQEPGVGRLGPHAAMDEDDGAPSGGAFARTRCGGQG
ncbi:TetR/AcrR family transcriptional regulator [Albimonas pacifica]|uniref:Transcriptional regulator, TetR family n=1 Tax=Albimonas pacifica TaxID=1114924 RepID=A0A1I3HR40_9RHOB|nr:TetR/AcrR family transcriptional regulator [Albimonas pacifica]SFI38195.1 transcriptional regulator, TetR family [Albimonas pacifica]